MAAILAGTVCNAIWLSVNLIPTATKTFVYGINNIKVISPDPGVATQFSSKATDSQGGRGEQLTVRIGDPNQTISAPTATYIISYDETGAMRSFNGYDEFFWDGPGFGNPLIKEMTITTTVPGGAQDATCFAGAPRSSTPCQTKNFTRHLRARGVNVQAKEPDDVHQSVADASACPDAIGRTLYGAGQCNTGDRRESRDHSPLTLSGRVGEAGGIARLGLGL